MPESSESDDSITFKRFVQLCLDQILPRLIFFFFFAARPHKSLAISARITSHFSISLRTFSLDRVKLEMQWMNTNVAVPPFLGLPEKMSTLNTFTPNAIPPERKSHLHLEIITRCPALQLGKTQCHSSPIPNPVSYCDNRLILHNFGEGTTARFENSIKYYIQVIYCLDKNNNYIQLLSLKKKCFLLHFGTKTSSALELRTK